MEPTNTEAVLRTYRYLRIGMALLVVLLAGGVLWQILRSNPHCWQTSISAYYFTAARGVFVATLGAIGTCLIVYRGNSRTEDVLLNFTGTAAGIVAFVPTQVDGSCKAENVPTPHELSAAVSNNGWALLLTGLIALITAAKVIPTAFSLARWNLRDKAWLALTSAAVLAGIIYFLGWRTSFRDHGHAAAAISLFLGIVLVVVSNAVAYGRHQQISKYTNRYAVVAGLMVLTLIVVVALHFADRGWRTWLFWLESGVIAEFATFWVIQTEELWGVVNRSQTPGGTGSR